MPHLLIHKYDGFFFVITLFIQKVTKIFSIAELKVEAIEATKF